MARTPRTPKQASQAQNQPPLRLEWWVADSLSDNPLHYRRHPDRQLSALKDVLGEVGWAGALLYNERTQRLIDGHARKKISSDKVPVLVGSWSEEQEKKILATLDPLAAMAEADTGAMNVLLSQVQTESEAVQALLANLAAGELVPLFDPGEMQGLTDPDDVPEPPDEATTQPGDLYQLGPHRLLYGDSSKPEDVDRLLDGAMIHLVNTDPPYNVRVEPRSNNAIAAGLSTFAAYGNSDPGRDVVRFPEKAKPTGKKMRAKDRPLEHQAQFDRNSQVFRACVAAAGLSISWPLISPMSFVAGPAVVGAPRLVLKPVEQDAVATTWKQAESYGDQTLHSGWT